MIRASAGSGKTHQLTNHYLGLAATGVAPDAILAATFTRKAAGEILDRVLERLAEGAADDRAAQELAGQLQLKNGTRSEFTSLLRRLLQNLARVRIGTLDSFFIGLAGAFSFELGLPAAWTICEEVDARALEAEALERLLADQPDDILRLFPLLSRGETKRSVHGELGDVIRAHYSAYRASERAAWERVQAPEPVQPAARDAALDTLRAYDFSDCGHKNFTTSRDKDIANFERGDWLAFLGAAMARNMLSGTPTFSNKPIPEEVQACYEILVQHARSEVLGALAQQTRATWELLDRFHQALWAQKQADGALRFEDVTLGLDRALRQRALRADSLGFRLNGAVDHLLLDEFQDTSQAQWRALEPLAQRITTAHSATRSFFCVGDVKQAIYGWRGGLAAIFDTLTTSLGPLEEQSLSKSRRSAPPVIAAVNQVFANLRQWDASDKLRDGLDAWANRFETHETHKTDASGHVTLETGPAQRDNESIGDQRKHHCAHVAAKVRDFHERAPCRSVGVLCRNNNVVARMIRDLRALGVEASEEGGNPLTDSPAVEVILSLCTLADHPGHSVARFHVKNSPLGPMLDPLGDADALARHLRRELLHKGYGDFVKQWGEALAPACNRRDLSRLQQLVEMAYDYQARSTLRADDFVAWVGQQNKPDPSGARIRVMTIHGAKGLEFDAVFLPELDVALLGQAPSFVVGRDRKTLDVNFVCRYANEDVQELLEPAQQEAFAQDRRQRVEESLSLLYVAMTRAIHALHMIVPGPRLKSQSGAWHNLLLQTLAPDVPHPEPCTQLYEAGDSGWFRHVQSEASPAPIGEVTPAAPIAFHVDSTSRRRGMEHLTPSSREGAARVRLDHLFHPSEGTGTAAGTLYHAWFEAIEWLDDGPPTDDHLLGAAARLRHRLPAQVWHERNRLLGAFRTWLTQQSINSILQRSAYDSPRQPAFPKLLADCWTPTVRPIRVERERRFTVLNDAAFWDGSLDRIVWLGEGERVTAADVIDFKTDALRPGDIRALAERTEHYRPQIEAYRRAVACMTGLPEERVAARLVFPFAGRIEEV